MGKSLNSQEEIVLFGNKICQISLKRTLKNFLKLPRMQVHSEVSNSFCETQMAATLLGAKADLSIHFSTI